MNNPTESANSGWFSKRGRLIDRIIDIVVVLGLITLVVLVLFMVYNFLMLSSPEVSNAAGLADLDGDSDLDTVLANGKNEGRAANTVWINQGGAQGGEQGDFSLLEQTQPWGLADSMSLSLGDLDIWVANCCSGWVSSGDGDITWVPAHNLVGFNDTLLEGGSLVRFKDSEQRLGISGSGDAALGDLNGDGDLDAFVANSSSAIGVFGEELLMERDQPDRVWLNDGRGYFTDSGQELGATES